MYTRVGIWAPSFRLGGSEIWCLCLLKALDRGRLRLAGLGILNARGNDPRTVQRAREYLPVMFGPEGLRRVAGASDVLVLWAIPNVNDYLGEPRPRTIMVSHSDPSWGWWTERQRRAAPAVDRFVAVSGRALEAVPAAGRASAIVIPNCVDVDRLSTGPGSRELVRRAWGVGRRRVLLTLGRLQPEREPFLLWDTVGLLPERFVGVLAGDGPLAAEARARASGRCLWVGQQLDVARAYSGADWYLNGSRTEGFGLAMAEAMAMRVPVVAAGGLGFLADHPGLAREVRERTPGALAAGVLADEEDGAGTRERAELAARTVLGRYGIGDFGRAWSELLAGGG